MPKCLSASGFQKAILDNLPTHHSKVVKEWAEKRMHYLIVDESHRQDKRMASIELINSITLKKHFLVNNR